MVSQVERMSDTESEGGLKRPHEEDEPETPKKPRKVGRGP